MSNPFFQVLVGDLPTSVFNFPAGFPTAGNSIEVTVGGAPVAFTFTGANQVTLRNPARGRSIVNFFDAQLPTLAGLTWAGSLDFPSIAAAGVASITANIPGADLGDVVSLGCPATIPAGVVYQAFVSAIGVVTVRASNFTAGAIDPVAGTFRVRVSKA